MMRLAKQFYYVMPQRFIFDFVPNSVSRLTRSDGTRASIEVMPIGQRSGVLDERRSTGHSRFFDFVLFVFLLLTRKIGVFRDVVC